jgi:hypothetical protein
MELGDASLLRSLVEAGADWRAASIAVAERAHALVRFPASSLVDMFTFRSPELAEAIGMEP